MFRVVLGHPLQDERDAGRVGRLVARITDRDERRELPLVGGSRQRREARLLRAHVGERRGALVRSQPTPRVYELRVDHGLVLTGAVGIGESGGAERLERRDVSVERLAEVDDDPADRVIVARLEPRQRRVGHRRERLFDRAVRRVEAADRVGLHAADATASRERTTRATITATSAVIGSARAICTRRGSSGSASYSTPDRRPPPPKPSAYTS